MSGTAPSGTLAPTSTKDGDICLELDLDMAGGVTVARIKDFIKTCKVSLIAFEKEVVK